MRLNEEAAVTPKRLSDAVTISRQFVRSIRIDTDFGREDSLSGYICQGTARNVLEAMARQVQATSQRAFTWTGPYGGGKSSLALLLCSLVGKDKRLREQARKIIDVEETHPISQVFSAGPEGWTVLPIVGQRGSVVQSLSSALRTARGIRRGTNFGRDSLIDQLVHEARDRAEGVLVVIDELGKYLEAASQGTGDDINFFQDLAEKACRCEGRLIVIGVLHQSFDAYASRLSRQVRDDWAKVQGRFVDVPLIAATDEVLELMSQAINVDDRVDRNIDHCVREVAGSMRERRPATPASIESSLSGCWPLHPVTAALLGPVSRRKFGQNERSSFGFLSSREPYGFAEFLDMSPVSADSMYEPARYWDYLRANLEPAILASPDGHRWSSALDAVERAEAKGTALHVSVTKTVALLELFRGGSGLAADPRVLNVAVCGADSKDQVLRALHDLVQWKILIERRHQNAFGLFAGSDFDIDGAIAQANAELTTDVVDQVSALADLQPVVAKRLYAETGSMRWFTRRIVQVSRLGQWLSEGKADQGAAGTFLLCLPAERGQDVREQIEWQMEMCKTGEVLLGVPTNAQVLFDLALELTAAQKVLKSRAELEGDAVARREVMARVTALQGALEEEVTEALAKSAWLWPGGPQRELTGNPSTLATKVARWLYPNTPHISSELINREAPSSNASKARRDLMYRMIRHGHQRDLGYEGFPADASLYHSTLRVQGLHRAVDSESWGFHSPDPKGSAYERAMWPVWAEAKRLCLADGTRVSVKDLHSLWSARPYGVRKGLSPILSLAFYMAHRSEVALYVDGVFTPELSELVIDEWLIAPESIRLQYVASTPKRNAVLKALSKCINEHIDSTELRTPLDIARALVAMVLGLPMWTRRTMTVSKEAQLIRNMLLKASDPNQVLFAELPALLGSQDPETIAPALERALTELRDAYPRMLRKVRRHVLQALDHDDGDVVRMRSRAISIKGVTGDLRIESLLAHLERYDDSNAVIEGLISSAISKPNAAWVDRDIDQALLQLSSFAMEFRKAEVVAPMVRGTAGSRHMIGIVFGSGNGRRASGTVDIDAKDVPQVKELVNVLVATLKTHRRELVLAALAEVGAQLVENDREHVNG
jgi:hypothetical protein